MPELPLPPLDQGVPLDGGDLPVTCTDDVKAEWSQDLLGSQTGPVIPAIIEGQTALLLGYQEMASYAAAQSDPLRATGEYLDEIGWERDIHRQVGELDPSYSARVNASQVVTDPNSIIAAVNAILAPYTSIKARYMERSDGWFVSDGTAEWSSHVFAGANQPPNYPDRRYDTLPNRRPGGARVFGDNSGRYFEIRIPDLAPVDQGVAAVFDGTEADAVGGFFVGGSGTPLAGTFAVTHGSAVVTASTSQAGILSPGQSLLLVQNGAEDAVSYQIASFDGVSAITLGAPYAGTVAAPTTALLNAGTAVNASFVRATSETEYQIYDQIINTVERIRGHSIRWTLLVDPLLAP